MDLINLSEDKRTLKKENMEIEMSIQDESLVSGVLDHN
jgi:hypothetical protein